MTYVPTTGVRVVDSVTDQAGNALAGITYTVTALDNTTPVMLYVDQNLTSPKTVISDSRGQVSFYIRPGDYIRHAAGFDLPLAAPLPVSEVPALTAYISGQIPTSTPANATAAAPGTVQLAGDLGGSGGNAASPRITDALRAQITGSVQNTALGVSVPTLVGTPAVVPTSQLPPLQPAPVVNVRPDTETSYTTTNADLNARIYVTNPAGETIHPHPNAAPGFACVIFQGSTSPVTFTTGGNGSVIENASGFTQTSGQGARVILECVANGTGANALVVISGDLEPAGSGGGGGGGGTSLLTGLLLDIPGLPAFNAWRSLRLCRATYTGALCRVHRVDNGAEVNIGPTSSGDLDTGAIINFGGATSGGGSAASNVTIVKLYDQTGNGWDWTVPSGATAPKIFDATTGIVTNGSGPPAFLVTAVTDEFTSTAHTAYTGSQMTAFAITSYQGESESQTPRAHVFWGPSGSSFADAQGWVAIARSGTTSPTGQYLASRSTGAVNVLGTASTGNAMDHVVSIAADPNYSMQVNGIPTSATPAGGSIGAFNITNDGFGYRDGSGHFANVGTYWGEGGFYEGVLSQSQIDQMRSNQNAYWHTVTPTPTGWTLVASEDMTTDPRARMTLYNFGTATSYTANSWMSANWSYDSTNHTLLMNAKRDTGGHREGAAGYWMGSGNTAIIKYGAWEVDYWSESAAGYGIVFLMWPDGVISWPVNGELDVIEIYAGNSTKYGSESNIHLDTVAGSNRHLKMPGTTTNSIPSDVTAGSYQIDWTHKHTARVEWQPGYVSVFVNGVLKGKTTDATFIPTTKPMRLTMQHEFYGVADSAIASLNAYTHITGFRAYTYSGGIQKPVVDASTTFSSTNSTTASGTLTVSSGLVNSGVIVAVANSGTGANSHFPTGVNYGGTAMTAVPGANNIHTTGADGHPRTISLFYLLAPPAGATIVTVTLNSGTSTNMACIATSLQHMAQTSTFGGANTSTGDAVVSASTTISTAAATDMDFAAIATRNIYANPGSSLNYIKDWNVSANTYVQVNQKTGSGSIDTCSYSWATGNDAAMVAIPIHGAV